MARYVTQGGADTFYSGIAQVAGALVGFLGGFFIVRLQTYAQEWRDMQLEIERLQLVDDSTRRALATVAPHDESLFEDLVVRNRDALRNLAPLIYRREHARFPVELIVQSIVLGCLTIVGIWIPMLSLSEPSQATKWIYTGSLAGLVLTLWLLMLATAGAAWRRLQRMPGI